MGERLRATVSGSFRRGMADVQDAVSQLTDLGIDVLSPADPRIVDQYGEFMFVASDRMRSISLVQRRHLAAIANSDFLWLSDPDGYVGSSASFELGYAIAVGTPIFASEVPRDLTLRHFVHVVRAVADVLPCLVTGNPHVLGQHVLLEPVAVIEAAHSVLERLGADLQSRSDDDQVDRATSSLEIAQKLFEDA
jgi:hypothetical protein